MTHKLKFAYVSLHIMTGLCLFFVFGAMILLVLQDSSQPPGLMEWVVIVMFGMTAIMNELIVRGLKQRKFWAWVTGLVLFAGSLLPVGVFGLYGLLAAGSRAEFGLGKTMTPQN